MEHLLTGKKMVRVDVQCTHSSPKANHIVILVHELKLPGVEEFESLLSWFPLSICNFD